MGRCWEVGEVGYPIFHGGKGEPIGCTANISYLRWSWTKQPRRTVCIRCKHTRKNVAMYIVSVPWLDLGGKASHVKIGGRGGGEWPPAPLCCHH